MKISHEISSVINKTHQTVDLYIFLLYEYSNILIKTFLNIKLKRPTPSPQSPENVFKHSLVFPVFRGLSGISGLFGKGRDPDFEQAALVYPFNGTLT